jgi:hypothetical protein
MEREAYPDVDLSNVGNSDGAEPAGAQAPESNADAGQVTQEQGSTEQQFNPIEWQLNFKGQQITPKDRQHLINLAQQGYGYSQAMEKLNREKQEIAQYKTQYDKYAKLDERFKNDPVFAQKIFGLLNGQEQAQQEQSNQAVALPPEFSEKLSKLEQFQEQFASYQADQKLQSEIEKLKSMHQDNWDFDDGEGTLLNKVLKHTLDGNFPSLESAYRDFMWDKHTANAKADALKAEAEKRQRDTLAGKVSAPGAKPAPAAPKAINFRQTGYNDLAAMAAKEFNK